jgi:hypothetical protein
MENPSQSTAPTSETGFTDKKRLQRHGRQSSPKRPELVLWVMIIMLLVKFAIILFGTK